MRKLFAHDNRINGSLTANLYPLGTGRQMERLVDRSRDWRRLMTPLLYLASENASFGKRDVTLSSDC